MKNENDALRFPGMKAIPIDELIHALVKLKYRGATNIQLEDYLSGGELFIDVFPVQEVLILEFVGTDSKG